MNSSPLFNADHDVVVKNFATLYQRTEKSINEDVEKLREWMTTQPHLPEVLSEKIIKNLFIRSKCSVEKTKQRIDMYYTIRSRVPDCFDEIHPENEKIQNFMKCVFWVPLPKTMNGIYRVFFFKIYNPELLDKSDPMDALKYLLDMFEVAFAEDTIFGEIYILDWAGVTLNYVVKFTPVFVAKCIAIYEKAFSMSMKGMFFINAPSYVNILTTLMKKLLKPKLAARIYTSGDSSVLTGQFDRRMLPKDYGGEEMSLKELQELVQEKFVQYSDRFKLTERLRVNENLRPEKLIDDDVLGFYGNFKKLDVD